MAKKAASSVKKTVISSVLENVELKKEAKKLAKATEKEQLAAFSKNGPYANDPVAALKLGVYLLEEIKDATKANNSNTEHFLSLCDETIALIKHSLEDPNLTAKERNQAKDQLMEVIRMADKNIAETRKATQDNIKTAITVSGVVVAAIGALKLVTSVLSKKNI
jgi:hypothetical protein